MLIALVNCTISSMHKRPEMEAFTRRCEGRKENTFIKKTNKWKRIQVQNNLGYTM